MSRHEDDLAFVVGVGGDAGVGVGISDGRGLAAGESVWRPRRRADCTALDVEGTPLPHFCGRVGRAHSRSVTTVAAVAASLDSLPSVTWCQLPAWSSASRSSADGNAFVAFRQHACHATARSRACGRTATDSSLVPSSDPAAVAGT